MFISIYRKAFRRKGKEIGRSKYGKTEIELKARTQGKK
jgi:hypothetical protein